MYAGDHLVSIPGPHSLDSKPGHDRGLSVLRDLSMATPLHKGVTTTHMTKPLTAIVFSVLLGLGSVVDASAQQSTTQGWVFGFDIGGAAVSFENRPRDGAGLVGARFGYGFNRIFTAYVAAYETDVDVREFDGFDKVTFGHVELGMRLHLAKSGSRWVPYGDLAATSWPVSDILKNGARTTTDFTGRPPYSVGGGLAIYLSDALALDVNFKAGKGGFKDVPVGNISDGATSEHTHEFLGIEAESARFTVGVSWWP